MHVVIVPCEGSDCFVKPDSITDHPAGTLVKFHCNECRKEGRNVYPKKGKRMQRVKVPKHARKDIR